MLPAPFDAPPDLFDAFLCNSLQRNGLIRFFSSNDFHLLHNPLRVGFRMRRFVPGWLSLFTFIDGAHDHIHDIVGSKKNSQGVEDFQNINYSGLRWHYSSIYFPFEKKRKDYRVFLNLVTALNLLVVWRLNDIAISEWFCFIWACLCPLVGKLG